jgi:hypothetical protein
MSMCQIPRLAALTVVLLVIASVNLRGEIVGGASTSTPFPFCTPVPSLNSHAHCLLHGRARRAVTVRWEGMIKVA